ncbi:hydrolase [Thalassotalea agarivorans]|uniref:AB hydrolase-1 domain-containing protein n=1 Tax=Thalassotalea agarivorans TaxID=349064 RepID=A0A1I0CUQ8_THASX|nr:hydrolase [Thalassotalea agarivorans]SET23488.1 hypothetical protein SAMN05660429_01336 [Thalassotalea agarivorans]
MIYSATFKPAWWLSNSHVQTMAAKLLRRNETISTFKQQLDTPDGDFIELAWTQTPDSISPEQPIVVILHGLGGSKDSHYAKGMLKSVTEKGWVGVLIHFRGCGDLPNRKAHAYHSGFTDDISFFSDYLAQHFHSNPKAIMGFSLGGNVLTRYLAQTTQSPYQSAAVICAPLHLLSCSERIAQGSSKIYQKYLVDMLKTSTADKIADGLVTHISADELADIRLLFDFDDKVTAPLNGFDNAVHYYESVSGRYVIDKIAIPTLFVHAKDDPFLAHEEIVKLPTLPEHVRFEVSEKGGHVGFISARGLKPFFWLEQRIPQFFEDYL